MIKLVGSIVETQSGIAAEVTPTFLPKQHPLAGVNDVMNAVYVESIGIGESMYYGPGAGQKPTATSVVAVSYTHLPRPCFSKNTRPWSPTSWSELVLF